MATGATAGEGGLTEEEVETFTDVMVGKLALLYAIERGDYERLVRDEIRQVIVDTELLVTGKVSMERWLEGDQDRVFRMRPVW